MLMSVGPAMCRWSPTHGSLDPQSDRSRNQLSRIDSRTSLTCGNRLKSSSANSPSSLLRAHRKRQLEERFAAGSRWRETGLVFTTPHGGFIEPRNANRMFHDVCTKPEVPQLRVHDLRHSCVTLLFTMGVQPATVQRILRHSSITVTTGTYVEVIEAIQRDALDSMGSLFGESDASASK